MKEISIEEKAKAYDEVLKVFSELKESEDERIREVLIELVHNTTGDSLWIDYDVHKEDAIAWLEKQGEQKPTDKIQQDTEIHDLWEYIQEWKDKFGRFPKNDDELIACVNYIMKKTKAYL